MPEHTAASAPNGITRSHHATAPHQTARTQARAVPMHLQSWRIPNDGSGRRSTRRSGSSDFGGWTKVQHWTSNHVLWSGFPLTRVDMHSSVSTAAPSSTTVLSDTLDKSNKATKKLHYADEKPKNNPYSRKEVTYVCETGTDLCAVVGGIFRRVREARELGEAHGKGVEARLGEAVMEMCHP